MNRWSGLFGMLIALSPMLALAQEIAPQFDPVFADHAVLQRDRPLRVRGTAAPGQMLTLGIAGISLDTVANAKGDWTATLPAMAAGGPYRLSATDKAGKSSAIEDVMVGDVFLCGGQSNMSYLTKYATNASNQLKTPTDPAIRFATIPISYSPLKQSKLPERIQWRIAAPDTLGESSAVCYYMALELKKEKGVTIGFVRSSLGGTRVESWLSAATLRDVIPQADMAKPPNWQAGPTVLYNGMIAPLGAYSFKGAVWYQGESNVADPENYRRLLPPMMRDWRQTFADPGLPFVIVQLTAFGPVATKPVKSDWAELREVQRQVALDIPKTALVVSIDVGDRSDIHPAQKKIVGQRVARAKRHLAYSDPVSVGGPRPLTAMRRGDDVVVRFGDTDGGLLTYSSNQAIGFEICDAARACRFTEARAEGDTIVLSGANRSNPAFVRYAWANSPIVNLYGKTDNPAIPFEMAIR